VKNYQALEALANVNQDIQIFPIKISAKNVKVIVQNVL
jgi:hypothetical protein